jgi:RHS repeat-associated protein
MFYGRAERVGCAYSGIFVIFAFRLWSPSPYINRFLSADTIVPGYANPQNLNRFSYVLNNPLRYTDPTGHMMVEGEGGSHVNYKNFPCADMHGLALDICRRGPKKLKTTKEIVKDIVTFLDPSAFLQNALDYPAGGPGVFVPAICQMRGKVCGGETVDFAFDVAKATYKIITGGPKRWLTPTVPPIPYLSPTPELTPTLVTPTNTMTPTITLTPSLTVTPSATLTQPTLTSTPVLTPVYWVP